MANGQLHCIKTDETHCLDEGGDWQGAATRCVRPIALVM